jgi:epoxyqueuosine reductase
LSSRDKIVADLRQASHELGFDSLAVASPGHDERISDGLKAYVQAGYHGTMDWIPETLERRSNPKTLWPDVRSVIVVTMNYGPEADPLPLLGDVERGVISVYARHRDYHDVIKGRLKTLASKLGSLASRQDLECEVKVFVDTAPVMEKPLAARAGLGWQGKHTNLVSRKSGSWLFIGSIFTSLDLPLGEAEQDHCGSCTNCLDICPTAAFPAPYQLDARRCISYLTIEHKGPIDEELRPAMGNRIYGCDDCLAVCPWNKFARSAEEMKLASPEAPRIRDLYRLLSFNDADFRQYFSGSPVKRIGRDRFIRNCLIAAGNSGSQRLKSAVRVHCDDANPVIKDAADWAMKQLHGVQE